MKFEQKPAVIDAFQWDGTLEGAESLRGFILEYDLHMGFIVHIDFCSDTSSASYIKFDRVIDRTMREHDWLVRQPNGSVEMIPNDIFNRDYKPLEEA